MRYGAINSPHTTHEKALFVGLFQFLPPPCPPCLTGYPPSWFDALEGILEDTRKGENSFLGVTPGRGYNRVKDRPMKGIVLFEVGRSRLLELPDGEIVIDVMDEVHIDMMDITQRMFKAMIDELDALRNIDADRSPRTGTS